MELGWSNDGAGRVRIGVCKDIKWIDFRGNIIFNSMSDTPMYRGFGSI